MNQSQLYSSRIQESKNKNLNHINKAFIKLISVSLFLSSCHHTQIKSGMNKKEVSKRQPASSSNSKAEAVYKELSKEFKRIKKAQQPSFEVLTKPVSAMVIFKNKKPICQLSAIKHPDLVPSQLQISKKNNLQLRLPSCHSKYISQIREDIIQNYAFFDKNGGYQVAGFPILGAAACLGGGALGVYLAKKTNLKSELGGFLLGFVGMTSLGFAVASVGDEIIPEIIPDNPKAFGRKKMVRLNLLGSATSALGVGGMCGGYSFAAVYLYKMAIKGL